MDDVCYGTAGDDPSRGGLRCGCGCGSIGAMDAFVAKHEKSIRGVLREVAYPSLYAEAA